MRVFCFALIAGLASASQDAKCGECVAVVEPFLAKFTADLDMDSFQQDLKWMCNSMRGDQSEHCEDLASKFGEPVYAALTSSEGAAQVCAVFDQCKDGDKMHLDYDFQCGDCKSKIRSWSNLNNIKKKLEDKLCSGMDDYTITHCTDIIEQFTPMITFMLKNLDMGSMFCSGVEMCPVKSSALAFHMGSHFESLAEFSSVPDVGCTTCKSIVKAVRFAMKLSGGKIDSSMCSMIPIAKQQCKDIFTLYAEDIINAIKKGFSNQQICSEVLSLCSKEGDATILHIMSFIKAQVPKINTFLLQSASSKSSSDESSEESSEESSSSSSSSSEEDDDMPIVASGLKDSSDNKTLTCRKCIATVDLMRTALEFTDISFDSSTVCKKIPLFGKMCSDFMDKYGDSIYDSLKKHLDDKTICVEKLKMCQASDFPDSVVDPASSLLKALYNRPAGRFYYHYITTEN